MKFTEDTTPAILKLEYENSYTGEPYDMWKVSPHWPKDADQDADWCESEHEAVELCEELIASGTVEYVGE